MTTEPGSETSDYSYDLVHEDVSAARQPEAQRPAAGADQSATESPDEGGDYSYDLAHDVPPAER